MPNPRCFLDVSVGEDLLDRVVFELFADRCPKTVENFRCLCTGERGISAASGKPLQYKGAPFHRIIPGFMCQGGDTTTGNGKGGESIYGSTFEDENLEIELDAPGLLVMANRGPDTNSSQFFITLAACPHLNGKHTVFGKVVAGLPVIEAKLAEVPTDGKDRPLTPVFISHCGELELRKKEPVRERSASVSEVSDDERERKRKRKAEKRDKRDRKEKRKKKQRSATPEPTEEALAAARRQKEMAEEEDRRMEEEKRRADAERKQELEKIRDRLGGDRGNGVVLKGRGAMKYREGGSGMRGWD